MREALEMIISKSLPEGASFDISENLGENDEIIFTINTDDEYKGKLIGRSG